MCMTKGRNSMTNENDDIKNLNEKLYEEAQEHNERIKDSMLVATSYIAVGTKILRTLLGERNYKQFMDSIIEEDVEPLKRPSLH